MGARALIGLGAMMLVTFIGPLSLPAKTLTFDAEKCHLDVPDDWADQGVAGNKVSVLSPDKTKSAVMRVVDVGPHLTVDSTEFQAGVEKSMTGNGATITARTKGTFEGLDAWILDATQQVPAGTVYNRMTIFMADGNAYVLCFSKLGGKPEQDDQLNAILNSFAFIGAPQPPQPGDDDERAGKFGEIVGGFIGIVAAFATLRWLLRPRAKKS